MESIKEKLEAFAAECRKGNTQEWESGPLGLADLRGADLREVNLANKNLYGANLECADLTCANLEGATLRSAELDNANLTGANLEGAELYGANLEGANFEGSKGFRFEDAPDPQALRYKVADQIEANPKLHNQSKWGDGDPDECGTPCCVAGWACRLGGGTRGGEVKYAAIRLLHVDGKIMPSFYKNAKRTKILEALRS